MSATMVGRRREIKKKQWLKCPKANPKKTKFGPKSNDSKSDIWNSVFENIIPDICFYVCPDFPEDIIRFFFFNFRFSSRKSQSQQKLARKITHFIIQSFSNTSLILRNSTHLTLEIICSCKSAKNLSGFTHFPANMFQFDVSKNIWAPPLFDAQELHSWNTLKANVCIFLYIFLREFFFSKKMYKNFFFFWW